MTREKRRLRPAPPSTKQAAELVEQGLDLFEVGEGVGWDAVDGDVGAEEVGGVAHRGRQSPP